MIYIKNEDILMYCDCIDGDDVWVAYLDEDYRKDGEFDNKFDNCGYGVNTYEALDDLLMNVHDYNNSLIEPVDDDEEYICDECRAKELEKKTTVGEISVEIKVGVDTSELDEAKEKIDELVKQIEKLRQLTEPSYTVQPFPWYPPCEPTFHPSFVWCKTTDNTEYTYK